jgi:hypothetical protein
MGEQRAAPGLPQHAGEEGLGDLPGQEPVAVLGEARRMPHGRIHPQAHKPAEEQIVVQLFHQLALAADGVQHLQQEGAEQLLGRDRGTAALGVERREAGRQLLEDRLDQRLDRPERMVRRDPLLEIDIAEHHPLARLGSPHHALPTLRSRHDTSRSRSAPYVGTRFSAAC